MIREIWLKCMDVLLSEVQPLHPQKTLWFRVKKIYYWALKASAMMMWCFLLNADMFVFFAFDFVACDPLILFFSSTIVFLLPSKTNVHVLIQVKKCELISNCCCCKGGSSPLIVKGSCLPRLTLLIGWSLTLLQGARGWRSAGHWPAPLGL